MSCVVTILCHPETFNIFHLYENTIEGRRKEIYPEHKKVNKKMRVARNELLKQDCQWLLALEEQVAEWINQEIF